MVGCDDIRMMLLLKLQISVLNYKDIDNCDVDQATNR